MKKVLSMLDKNFEPIMIAIIFYAMTLLIVVQVILRFGFQGGFSWGEEVARYMFVWLMFFSFSYATRNQRHIRINFVVDKFNIRVKKTIYIIVDILFLAFVLYLFRSGLEVAKSIIKYGDMAVSIKVSMNIVYNAGLLGFALMSIRLIQSIIWKIKNFNEAFDKFENFAGVYTGVDDMCLVTKSIKEKALVRKKEDAAADKKNEEDE